MTQYKMKVRTLSPLHIGSGNELRLGFDFAIAEERTYRLNVDAILADFYDSSRPNRLPKQMLRLEDYQNPRYFRYVIEGAPKSEINDARLQACVKDAYDCPYIPGSSIKGALRAALATEIIRKEKIDLPTLIPTPFKESAKPKRADDQIEKRIFGPDPNHDLFKALQVSDMLPPMESRKPGFGLFAANITPISSKASASAVPIAAECVRQGADFFGTLRFDDYVIANLFPKKRETLLTLMPSVQAHSLRRLKKLYAWYEKAPGCKAITDFLSLLIGFCPKMTSEMALIQVGAGSGWDGMTYGEALQQDAIWFEKILKFYQIQKKTKVVTPRRAGDPFPTSRKITVKNQTPIMPLGWLLLDMEES